MILDSNALSALAEQDPDLIQLIQRSSRLCVTLITVGEYHYGISQSRRRTELADWLEALLARADVLQPTLQTIPHYAAIRSELKAAGTPIPANDCWIAALVRQHDLPIVSRDRHFDCVGGIRRLDW